MSGIVNINEVGPVVVTIEEMNAFQEMVRTELTEVILATDEKAINVRFNFMSVSIPVFFDKTSIMIDPQSGLQVMSINPTIRTAEHLFTIRKPKDGDYVNVKGVLYNVMSCDPDGAGMVEISLHKK